MNSIKIPQIMFKCCDWATVSCFFYIVTLTVEDANINTEFPQNER